MSKKYFVVADVHSFYTELQRALDAAGFDKDNPEHVFISCGDLFDRGAESCEVLNFVMSLPKERRIFIRGNHEDLLEKCIKRKEFFVNDLSNGTLRTILNLAGHHEDEYWLDRDEWSYHKVFDEIKKVKPLWDYLKECRNYYQLGKYVFVHSWYPFVLQEDELIIKLNAATEEEWDAARWGNPFEFWYDGVNIPDSVTVVGHWHTSWAHSFYHKDGTEFGPDANFDIFVDEGIVGLDACTAYSHKCNCFVIEE